MNSYNRLKERVEVGWSTKQLTNDIQELILENEKYRKAYTSLKSCQHIAGVIEDNMLAGKIKELQKDSKLLRELLEIDDKKELFKKIQNIKEQKNSGI